ncbi:hypothetical protein CHCC5022_1864 [Bacillus paralicheniformis]|nr:hypothetical protein CHCC5022_1864 [Bacillus paralicheniformis]TWJ71984.1 hypothetical protein CHCC4186_3249 [Bacillus paralicheniformis]
MFGYEQALAHVLPVVIFFCARRRKSSALIWMALFRKEHHGQLKKIQTH